MTKQQARLRVRLYARLSKDDGDADKESNSITNQLQMLRYYSKEKGFEIIDEYVDDGYSGTTFNRPDLNRMIEDAMEDTQPSGIMVKDMSRFGRNNLMKYIPDKSRNKYMTNFTDEILSTEWKEAELENDDLENYKVRVEYYVRQHQDNHVIAKLKKNQSLTEKDVAELEKILWSELGTKEDYEAEFGRKPLGEFVREMVGLDMNAAKEAFSKYLEDVNLDSRQIYFVNQIIEYIVHNGMMKDLSVLLESPFTDRGSISEIFTDMGVWLGIKKVIDTINANAAA